MKTKDGIRYTIKGLYPIIEYISVNSEKYTIPKEVIADSVWYYRPDDHTINIEAKLPWWTWFGAGLIHRYIKAKIEELASSYGVLGAKYEIEVV